MGIDLFDAPITEPAFQAYLFQLTKKYSAKEIKRFNEYKRYALMICFLLESRRALLDHLVNMHDQYILEIVRQSKNAYEKKHRQLRKRQKKAVDVMLNASQLLLDWPDEEPMPLKTLWQQVNKSRYQSSVADLREFKQLNDRGYGDLLLNRYPSLRKYFADFVHLPFEAERGSEVLMQAIRLVRQLDSEERKPLPTDTPTSFIPRDMRPLLTDKTGKIQRNAWEMGLALAMKDALRSGDLYLPQSKQHVSFWSFLFSDEQWQTMQEVSYIELQQPRQPEALTTLTSQFNETVSSAQKRFPSDNYAQIADGILKLKRHDKASKPDTVARIQAGIDASLPAIRIERLLMEVDKVTQFTAQFLPVQGRARPRLFYKTLISFLISQATNLGLVAMSASVKDVSVDMMRHVQDFFVREETIHAANTAIVDKHHQLPLSAVHGAGAMSSSDAQRFGIRASSLLASYYPRYYGYYRKAIGIYTHVSDQYSVFSTKVISCGPREALYVLDGLLENNTVLPIKKHTTDTHGYTEIIFALCYLLGYSFMPRIRDLKDQQLYRIDKNADYGVFDPLLTKSADLYIIQEQWDEMIRVAFSLLNRTVPAHLIVQRLTASYPSDRLSKAFTNLGRIIKTQYILCYLTDRDLRHSVQRQLNKGEYRHKLPRWIFFAGQGEFMTGDYEEIMNKASCLSLVSNAILYWNTVKIQAIVTDMRQRGEDISNEALSHISLLPYKHVLPNGTYFIDDYQGDSVPKPTVSDSKTSSQP